MKTNITSTKFNFFWITEDEIGRRLDNFLHGKLKGIPKNLIYKLLRKSKIRVNERRVDHAYKLVIGDKVQVPKLIYPDKKNLTFLIAQRKIDLIANAILYNDNYLLAINKPSGIAVHGGSGLKFSIIDLVRILLPNLSFLELVHRLDRETSGILLFAKKKSVLRILHEQFRGNLVKKSYYALVCGRWPSQIKTVHVPLKKNIINSGAHIVCVNKTGKISTTCFSIVEYFFKKNTTLIKVNPITGRTHQIRVHAKYAGHPIAFDKIYGDHNFNQQIAETGLNRLFLHASSMVFFHPILKKEICITAPLNQELKKCLSKLRSSEIK
ncbi:MAG: 23S rRNA pseudouridine(955/2504/2580) synthase RluC [Candidatus Dasytiphilus stammeri]